MYMDAGRRIIVFRFLSAYGIVKRSMQSRLKRAFIEEKLSPLSYGHTVVVMMCDPVFSARASDPNKWRKVTVLETRGIIAFICMQMCLIVPSAFYIQFCSRNWRRKMSPSFWGFKDSVRARLKENFGKVSIAIGILLVVFGVSTSSMLGTVASAFGLFSGFVLIAYGFFAQVGLFSVEWRSINGAATMILCVSVAFFAIALVSLLFQEVSRADVIKEIFRGSVSLSVRLLFTRPFLYLFVLGSQLGLIFFVISVILKVYSLYRR